MLAATIAPFLAQSNPQSRGVMVGLLLFFILMIIAGAVILALKKKK